MPFMNVQPTRIQSLPRGSMCHFTGVLQLLFVGIFFVEKKNVVELCHWHKGRDDS